MKAAIVLCFVAFAAVVLARPDEKYTDRYDNINVDEILNNDKIFKNYADCILSRGKCTPEAKELKSHVEDGMKTNCSKCTDAQRIGTDKVIGYLINHKPTIWEVVKAKFDPTNKYAPVHERKFRIVKKE